MLPFVPVFECPRLNSANSNPRKYPFISIESVLFDIAYGVSELRIGKELHGKSEFR